MSQTLKQLDELTKNAHEQMLDDTMTTTTTSTYDTAYADSQHEETSIDINKQRNVLEQLSFSTTTLETDDYIIFAPPAQKEKVPETVKANKKMSERQAKKAMQNQQNFMPPVEELAPQEEAAKIVRDKISTPTLVSAEVQAKRDEEDTRLGGAELYKLGKLSNDADDMKRVGKFVRVRNATEKAEAEINANKKLSIEKKAALLAALEESKAQNEGELTENIEDHRLLSSKSLGITPDTLTFLTTVLTVTSSNASGINADTKAILERSIRMLNDLSVYSTKKAFKAKHVNLLDNENPASEQAASMENYTINRNIIATMIGQIYSDLKLVNASTKNGAGGALDVSKVTGKMMYTFSHLQERFTDEAAKSINADVTADTKWQDIMNSALAERIDDITGQTTSKEGAACSDITVFRKDLTIDNATVNKKQFFKSEEAHLCKYQEVRKMTSQFFNTQSIIKEQGKLDFLAEVYTEHYDEVFFHYMQEKLEEKNPQTADGIKKVKLKFFDKGANHLEGYLEAFSKRTMSSHYGGVALTIDEILYYIDVCLDRLKFESAHTVASYAAIYETDANRAENAEMVASRNVATTRLADMLGIGNLVARSEHTTLENSAHQKKGISMVEAEGQPLGDLDDDEIKAMKFKVSFVKDLTTLQVFDNICGQIDRHIGNYTFIPEEEPVEGVAPHVLVAKGLVGIDNDASFGAGLTMTVDDRAHNYRQLKKVAEYGEKDILMKSVAKQNTPEMLKWRKNVGIDVNNTVTDQVELTGYEEAQLSINHLDKSAAEHILALTPESVRLSVQGIIGDRYIEALVARVLGMQQMIKNSITLAKKSGEKFLLEPEEWTVEMARELLRNRTTYIGAINELVPPGNIIA